MADDMNGWRPITETEPPRDPVLHIDLFRPNEIDTPIGEIFCGCRWYRTNDAWGMRIMTGAIHMLALRQPTHWRPSVALGPNGEKLVYG